MKWFLVLKQIYSMKKLVVPIAGMHCRSCEILIEDKLSEVPEIKKSHVSYKRGVAEISFENKPTKQAIEDAVRSAGYTIGVVGKNLGSVRIRVTIKISVLPSCLSLLPTSFSGKQVCPSS